MGAARARPARAAVPRLPRPRPRLAPHPRDAPHVPAGVARDTRRLPGHLAYVGHRCQQCDLCINEARTAAADCDTQAAARARELRSYVSVYTCNTRGR